MTLTQKLFRREPAITKLDQLFTSYPKSSESFALLTSSVLHEILLSLQPAQDKLALASGLTHTTQYINVLRAFNTRFPYGSDGEPSYPCRTRKLVGSFFNRHAIVLADFRSLQTYGFRFYFIALTGLLFTFPSRYQFTIDHNMYLALPDSPGKFLHGFCAEEYSRIKTRVL